LKRQRLADEEAERARQDLRDRLLVETFQELRQDIKDEFHRLGDNFSSLVSQAASPNTAIVEDLQFLMQQLEYQRKAGTLDVHALCRTASNMDSDVSIKIATSLSTILLSSSQWNVSSSEEMNKKLDILTSMVANAHNEVTRISKSVRDINRLNSKIAEHMTQYPHTFVILPKPHTEKLTIGASKVFKVANFVTRKVLNPFKTMSWEESVLFFVCPVSMKIVQCGPQGKGYNIKLSKETLKKIVPVLGWGMRFLKVGLVSQELGRVIPKLLIDDHYIRSVEEAIVLTAQPALAQTRDNFDQIFDQTVDSMQAFKDLADILMEEEKYKGRELKQTGLVKVISTFDRSSMWVSPECVQEFLERGLNAIQLKGGKCTKARTQSSQPDHINYKCSPCAYFFSLFCRWTKPVQRKDKVNGGIRVRVNDLNASLLD